MDFINVSAVKIPEGEVSKITETATGRVLWQKEKPLDISNASWLVCNTGMLSGFCPPLGVMSMARAKPQKNTATSNNYHLYPFISSTFYNFPNAKGSSLPAINGQTAYPQRPDILQPDKNTASYVLSNKGASGDNGILGEYAVALSDCSIPANGGETIYSDTQGHWGAIALTKVYTSEDNKYTYKLTHNVQGSVNTQNAKRLTLDATPRTEAGVFITYSGERGEFLVTGLNKGSFVVPKNFTSSTSISYNSNSLARSCWVPELHKYFASTGTNKNVSYSSDGITWQNVQAISSGNVLGIEYLSGQGQLCAVSSNTNKVALSTDGLTWQEKTAPFTSALAYEYDDENNVFVIVNASGAYITRNFTKWFTVPLPSGVSVNFRDLVCGVKGIFVGYEFSRRQLFFLSLFSPLTVADEVLSATDLSKYTAYTVSKFPY